MKAILSRVLVVQSFVALLLLAVVCASQAASAAAPGQAAKEQFISIGGGASGGVYFIVAAALATVLERNVPGLKVTAESTAATAENVRRVGRKEIALGLSSSDGIHKSMLGLEEFGKHGEKYPNLRIVMRGYPSPMQFFVLADSKIQTISDLKGKKVVALTGNTRASQFPRVLKAYGMVEKDLAEVKAGPSSNELVAAIAEGRSEVGVIGGAVPLTAITDLATRRKIRFLPVTVDKVAIIQKDKPYMTAGVMKARSYSGQDVDVPVVQGDNFLIAYQELDANLVYAITKALSAHTADLKAIHPKAAEFTAEHSIGQWVAPYHPGAEKYYKEKGLLKSPAAGGEEVSDLFVSNGRVRTLESGQPTAEAVRVKGGRIAAVGSNQDLLRGAQGVKKFDAGGRAVLPGFIDSHVHYWRSGLMEQMLDLRPLRSIPEVLAAVRRRAGEMPAGSLLMARGFMDARMAENRWPTRAEPDEAAPEQVVCIRHNNGHACAINSKSLAFLQIPRGTRGVELDPSTGEPTGMLREKVRLESEQRLYTLAEGEMYGRCLDIMGQIAVKAGATTVHCLEGGRMEGDPDVVDYLKRQQELPHNTILYYQTTDVDKIVGMGLPRIGGCILIDGTPAVHTGALFEPYADKPDSIGPTYWQQEELDEFVWKAHSTGLQIAVHATCERARRIHAYRWHVGAGVALGGGSDSPVTPINPLAGIHAAVNHSVLEQRFPPQEAVRLFTVDSASLAFEENEAGTLKPGKRGDLMVLSDDPMTVDPAAIRDIRVEATVVQGLVVYQGECGGEGRRGRKGRKVGRGFPLPSRHRCPCRCPSFPSPPYLFLPCAAGRSSKRRSPPSACGLKSPSFRIRIVTGGPVAFGLPGQINTRSGKGATPDDCTVTGLAEIHAWPFPLTTSGISARF